MSQQDLANPAQAQVMQPAPTQSVLPGFAKLFLVQLYGWLCAFFIAQAALGVTFNDSFEEEVIFWYILACGLTVWSLAAIIGLHCRAKWAPLCCSRFCLAQIVFLLLVIVRVMYDLDRSDYGYSSYSPYDMYELWMLTTLFICLPIFYAWKRYFAESPRLAAAFMQSGINATLAEQAPVLKQQSRTIPAGPALAQTLGASYLFFILGYVIIMLRAGTEIDRSFIYLLFSFHALALFPLALCLALRKPGLERKLIFGIITAWLFFCAFCNFSLLFPLAQALELNIDAFYGQINLLSNMPLPKAMLFPLLMLLIWRLAVSKEDAAWFAPAKEAADSPESDRSHLIAALLLLGYVAYHLMLVCGSSFAQFITSETTDTGQMDISTLLIPLCSLAGLVFCGASSFRLFKKNSQPAPMAYAAFISCLLCMLLTLILRLNDFYSKGEDWESISQILLYLFKFWCPPSFVSVLGLLYFRARVKNENPGGNFSAPLPVLAFCVFCGLYLCLQIAPRLIVSLLAIIQTQSFEAALYVFSDNNFNPYNEPVFNFTLDTLAAYLILPLLLLGALLRPKTLRQSAKVKLYVLLGIWPLCLFSVNITQLFNILLNSYSGDPFLYSRLLGSEMAYPLVACAAFIWYLTSSREMNDWLKDKILKQPVRCSGCLV